MINVFEFIYTFCLFEFYFLIVLCTLILIAFALMCLIWVIWFTVCCFVGCWLITWLWVLIAWLVGFEVKLFMITTGNFAFVCWLVECLWLSCWFVVYFYCVGVELVVMFVSYLLCSWFALHCNALLYCLMVKLDCLNFIVFVLIFVIWVDCWFWLIVSVLY